MSILTVPVLCAVWLVLPSANEHFFNGKWAPALILIPFLFLRMVPGLATTPLGPLIMVQRGGYSFARANMFWTLAEILGALVCVLVLGPTGLAWSSASVVWLGLWIMVNSLEIDAVGLSKDVASELFRRPSLIFSSSTALVIALFMKSTPLYSGKFAVILIISGVMVLCSYLLEPEVRGFLLNEKV